MLIEITYNVTDVYMSTTETPVYVEISFEQPGGTSAVWGSITGTLSNQTDLQNALNAKFDDPTGTTAQYLRGDGSLATFPSLTGYVPYTGATSDVSLGEYELKAGQLTLDVSPTGTAAVGTTRWNDTTGVSETTLKGGNVLLRNGVDLVARVVNKVSPNTTLTKAAYQAVRVSGAQGQRLAVAFAQANNDANSADTIGLVIETIPTNQEGFIMVVGQLENINTTGSLQGETWNDGDVLYLSPTIAGAITKVKPTGNGHIVIIGYVEYAHANNGKIYVKVMNGWELDELHDVAIVSPANNEALIYESATSLWKNKTIATALGYTPANAATTLTINGVTYDLSTSRTWTIAAGISGSGASGQVAYWNGTSSQTGSNNFLWDNANQRLSITGQSATSTTTLSAICANGTLSLNNASQHYVDVTLSTTNTQGSVSNLWRNNSSLSGALVMYSSAEGNNLFGTSRNSAFALLNNSGTKFYIGTINATDLIFGTTNLERMRLFSGGNFSIGTTSDLGTRLGVVGDTLLRGSGNSSATTALTVQNSSSTNLFTVRNDGFVNVAALASSANLQIGNFLINNITTSAITTFSMGARSSFFEVAFASGGYSWTFRNTSNILDASGLINHFNLTATVAPTSGTLAFNLLNLNPTINQTGGANGITRGLYVNPTLTAAADFRAIETARGNIVFSNLPTSSAGLPSGALWNNGGVINIV